MKKYALKNISQIKIVDGSVEIKYNDGALFKLKENCVFDINYKNTNTAKSLLLALNNIDSNNNIVWLNGDVVFDKEIIKFANATNTVLVFSKTRHFRH